MKFSAPHIATVSEKKFVGKRTAMSFSNNKTEELWRGFMIQRKEIKNTIGQDLYSLQIYPPLFFEDFNPNITFEKWALTEVHNFNEIPSGMESFTLIPGMYAVFLYKGTASDAGAAFEYIFKEWLPNSGYTLDQRPHFEILGEKYSNHDADSEEGIWIPIKFLNKLEK